MSRDELRKEILWVLSVSACAPTVVWARTSTVEGLDAAIEILAATRDLRDAEFAAVENGVWL